MDSNGTLSVLISHSASLSVPMGVFGRYASSWIFMEPYMSLCVRMVLYGYLLVLIRPYKSLCVLLGSKCPYGSLLVLIRPDGSLWVLLRAYGF